MKSIWIDLDNTPHVPLFKPIISELQSRGFNVIVSARDYAQTLDLLNYWKMDYTPIGKHGGKTKIGKLINLVIRSFQLLQFIYGRKVDLALNHGSRTQSLTSKIMRIPCIVMMDYEYTESRIFRSTADVILMPEVIPKERLLSLGFKMKKIRRYKGFKEELYLDDFVPDNNLRKTLGIKETEIFVVMRPSAFLGNYHDDRSETIMIKVLERITEYPNTFVLLLSRTKEDRNFIIEKCGKNVHFLDSAVEGLQLIYSCDLFISGGGTMNREAALMGTPTYSIFTGKKPFMDEYLARQGKLIFVDDIEKVELIRICKKQIQELPEKAEKTRAKMIADKLIELMN